MGILVEGRAVTGPIGIHCVQGEEVLAVPSGASEMAQRAGCPQEPDFRSRLGAGPSLLQPRVLGAALSHMSRLRGGYPYPPSARLGRMSEVGMCEPQRAEQQCTSRWTLCV